MLLKIDLILLLLVSIITFFFYLVDKHRAKHQKWRIKEQTLLLLSFFFGAPGALLAMLLCRHKIRKPKFFILVPLFLLLHLGIILFLYVTKPF